MNPKLTNSESDSFKVAKLPPYNEHFCVGSDARVGPKC